MIVAILNILAAAGVIFLCYTTNNLDPGISPDDGIRAMTDLSKKK